MRGMLRSWPLTAQRAFFERDLGIPLALEEETGKLFPVSNRARDVRDALLERRARARRRGSRSTTTLTGLEPRAGGWVVETDRGALDAARVVLATGGLSVPATGSDGDGLRDRRALGHRVHDVYPALTPLSPEPRVHAALSGVSLPVRLRARAGAEHAKPPAGFSSRTAATAVQRCSTSRTSPCAVVARAASCGGARAVVARSMPAWEAALGRPLGWWQRRSATHLPQRLALQLMAEAGVPADRRASAELRRAERIALIERLTSYVLPWTGDEGYKKAEVTGGGVALDEVDPRTLESRRHPGLFLCGEMLDAFGPIGGHNFAWAWATGRLAGIGAAS